MARGPLITAEERREMHRRVRLGERPTAVARALGRPSHTVHYVLRQDGGVNARPVVRSPLRLSLAEREEISRGLESGATVRAIAAALRRAPSTVSREVARNGGRSSYRAWRAERMALHRARRPKPAKLAQNGRLRAVVEALLERRWSPGQIARRLPVDYPDDPELRVSHETIYQSLFVQSRGALRAELRRYLRTGRPRRRPRTPACGVGELPDMLLLRDRPPEIEDRAVPGHWEGDLLVGMLSRSAIGTLVERQTRYVLLLALPDGHTAPLVRAALARQVAALPAHLRRSLTWDRGKEMAEHVAFTVATGVQVYFCDPHSPWQRGSNENTNGLLRQYFPKGTDLSRHSQAELDLVAAELNDRPRQTLAWMKPSEAFARLVAITD
jgi:transposase, IS30 family